MHVSVIDMRGFMSHRETHLELPDRGVVLITGPNGSGKSSVVEAVSTAAFGKTLRGTDPWAGAGEVCIKTDSVYVNRSCTKGGSKKLKWRPLDRMDDEADFETNTKAQEALESHIGSHDVWRRTHVFSSSDASNFTMATDAQRKRLLETILCLAQFDVALSACRSDRKDAESRHRETSQILEHLRGQLEVMTDGAADATQILATMPEARDTVELNRKKTKLAEMMTATDKDMAAIQHEVKKFERSTRDLYADARAIRHQMAMLGEGNCDKCGQPIPEQTVVDLKNKVDAADVKLRVAKDDVDQKTAELIDQLPELQDEYQDLRDKRIKLGHQIDQERSNAHQRETAQAAVDRAEKSVSITEDQIKEGGVSLIKVKKEIALAKTVELVLGLKGVRAHVLGRVLSGLELAANAWLTRIAGSDYQLTLKSYTEKKGGGVTDAISMEVAGAGGGHGYMGASGGERRRIDVALLLALAEVAQAAYGRQGGTIWADECFDALDVVGVERVSEVLQELAEDRTVVVISHNPDLQQALKPVLWFDVMDGEMTQVL